MKNERDFPIKKSLEAKLRLKNPMQEAHNFHKEKLRKEFQAKIKIKQSKSSNWSTVSAMRFSFHLV